MVERLRRQILHSVCLDGAGKQSTKETRCSPPLPAGPPHSFSELGSGFPHPDSGGLSTGKCKQISPESSQIYRFTLDQYMYFVYVQLSYIQI